VVIRSTSRSAGGARRIGTNETNLVGSRTGQQLGVDHEAAQVALAGKSGAADSAAHRGRDPLAEHDTGDDLLGRWAHHLEMIATTSCGLTRQICPSLSVAIASIPPGTDPRPIALARRGQQHGSVDGSAHEQSKDIDPDLKRAGIKSL
jgi:hypothetical protein